MLKRIGRTNTPGVFRWKIWLRLPDRVVHTHVELPEVAAQKMYAELLEQKARLSVGLVAQFVSSARSLGDAADAYLRELAQSGYNDRHCEQMRLSLGVLLDLLTDEAPLAAITREHVQRWRSARQAQKSMPGASTVNKGLAHLSAFFAWCCRQGWIEANPAQYAQRIKAPPPPMKILMWADYCKFMDAMWQLRPAMAVMFEVLGETGARIGEVLSAKVGSVDERRKIWTKVVKPGKVLESDAGEWALWAAAGRPKDSPLCPDEKGEHWEYGCVQHALEALVKSLGLDFVAHGIRHGRACWDLADGKSIWEVKTKLGHSTVTVTEGYLKAANTIKRSDCNVTIHSRPLRVVLCSKISSFSHLLGLLSTNRYGQGFQYKLKKPKDLG